MIERMIERNLQRTVSENERQIESERQTHPGVSADVHLQPVVLTEGFVAVRTLVRTLTCRHKNTLYNTNKSTIKIWKCMQKKSLDFARNQSFRVCWSLWGHI